MQHLQFIPNMDGFPNGRRLEDDVTLIELQAVSGVVLAAIGLWYDDFDGTNPVSQDLLMCLLTEQASTQMMYHLKLYFHLYKRHLQVQIIAIVMIMTIRQRNKASIYHADTPHQQFRNGSTGSFCICTILILRPTTIP